MATVNVCDRCLGWPCRCSVTQNQNVERVHEQKVQNVLAKEADAIVRMLYEWTQSRSNVSLAQLVLRAASYVEAKDKT